MGIFTNYKKKIEEEQQSWENDLQSYNREIASIKTMIEKACYLYNQEIATINSERSSLKELINKLYHFLKEFGEIGSKITPFDFVNESWQKIDVDAIVNSEMVPEASKKGNDDIYKYAAVGAFASTTVLTTVSTLLTPIPLAAPALLIPALFGGVSKKDYLAYQTKHLEALEEYDNKTVKWTATVHRIEPDRVVMSDETYNGLPVNPLNVFLDKEELPALDKGDTITVIGTLKFGFPADRIENAYIVK